MRKGDHVPPAVFKKNLECELKRRDIKQQDLAKALNMSTSTISKYKDTRRYGAPLYCAKLIADKLGVPLYALTKDDAMPFIDDAMAADVAPIADDMSKTENMPMVNTLLDDSDRSLIESGEFTLIDDTPEEFVECYLLSSFSERDQREKILIILELFLGLALITRTNMLLIMGIGMLLMVHATFLMNVDSLRPLKGRRLLDTLFMIPLSLGSIATVLGYISL